MTKQPNEIGNNIEPQAELPEVQNELSKVATNPKQSILIFVVISAVFVYVFYTFIVQKESKTTEAPVVVPPIITKPAQEVASVVPEIPKLPAPPKLELPAAPPPPPPAAVLPPPALPSQAALPVEKLVTPPKPADLPVKLVDSDADKQRKDAKRKSAIILVGGQEPKKTEEQAKQESIFQDRGDMTMVLARGKIIDAVLETAINTDFIGELRAVISRDVYSEQEKVILIPKGSKAFGSFTATDSSGYGRISIIWNRIDLANGYTINLEGNTVDNLGRKGVQGRVDNKFKERFTNAILISAFNIAFANALDKVIAPPPSTQVTAANISLATNLQNLAQSANANVTSNMTASAETAQIDQLCAAAMGAITDKTSTAYTSLVQTCPTIRNSVSTQPGARLTAAVQAVNSAATTLLTSTTSAATPTQAQQASQQAFQDVTKTVTDMITAVQFNPTTTIDQGTPIKIYVNKDYKFPKNVLQKSKLVK